MTEETCLRCGHERDAHSGSMGCVARDSDGDCECFTFKDEPQQPMNDRMSAEYPR